MSRILLVRHLGLRPYDEVWQAMKTFTDQRDENTDDELWLVQHPPVFTQGQAGRNEHILDPGDIRVVQTDRGGQVTYHGPGQLVAYPLLDLKRLTLSARGLVTGLENSVTALLRRYGVDGEAKKGAPGVYVEGAKIAALGLRIRRGCSYHGLALNVDMDLNPFSRINPCGYEGLEVVDAKGVGITAGLPELADGLVEMIRLEFGYDSAPQAEDA